MMCVEGDDEVNDELDGWKFYSINFYFVSEIEWRIYRVGWSVIDKINSLIGIIKICIDGRRTIKNFIWQ